jgi:hypothetical protein
VKVPDAFPVPPGSWRLSWDELGERTDATRERLQRLVELGILTPTDANQPFRSGDIHRVRAVAALELICPLVKGTHERVLRALRPAIACSRTRGVNVEPAPVPGPHLGSRARANSTNRASASRGVR